MRTGRLRSLNYYKFSRARSPPNSLCRRRTRRLPFIDFEPRAARLGVFPLSDGLNLIRKFRRFGASSPKRSASLTGDKCVEVVCPEQGTGSGRGFKTVHEEIGSTLADHA